MILQNKVKSTFMVDGEVYKKIRILAIEKNMEVSAVIEEAMREKLDREYQQPQLQLQQPQSQKSQEQKQESDIFSRDIITPVREREGEGELHLVLPGLKFPTNKDKLMQIAKKFDAGLEEHQYDSQAVAPYIEKLPDAKKTYKDESRLEEDIKKVCNTDKELIENAEVFDVNKIVGVIFEKSIPTPTSPHAHEYTVKRHKEEVIGRGKEKR
jgi:hypothetical protein